MVGLNFLRLKNKHFVAEILLYGFPFLLLSIGLWQIHTLVGFVHDTGVVSILLVPVIGPFIATWIGRESVWLSTFILFGYIFGPITWYSLVYYLTRRLSVAYVVGSLLLLPIFPFSRSLPERLQLALFENDGAYIVGLTVMPLSAAAFLHFLRYEKKESLLAFIAAGVLTSFVSFFALFLLFIVIFYMSISSILINEGRNKFRRFLIASGLLIAAIIVVYNVSLYRIIVSEQGIEMLHIFLNFLPMCFFLIPTIGIVLFLLFDRRPRLQPLFLGFTLTITFGILHFIQTSLLDIAAFDQRRFAGILSFSVALLLGVVIVTGSDMIAKGAFLDTQTRLFHKRKTVAQLLLVFVIGVCLVIALVPRI